MTRCEIQAVDSEEHKARNEKQRRLDEARYQWSGDERQELGDEMWETSGGSLRPEGQKIQDDDDEKSSCADPRTSYNKYT
jgi:hypothetical protein